MSAERPELRLLPESGEIPADAPETYAAALDEIDRLRDELQAARVSRDKLIEDNQALAQTTGQMHARVKRLEGERNKELCFHKDYAAVERLWSEVWKPHHERAGVKPPDDWVRLALDRLKYFEEAQLARALYGAIHNPPAKKGGGFYNQWDNAFRNTGNVLSYIERADLHEGREHREREAHPEVAQVLGALGVASLRDLANRCDCGELMIVHGTAGRRACDDPDDRHYLADRWLAEQADRHARGLKVSDQAHALLRVYGYAS